MPKISVLMGVYNNADTVGKSIESILQQTFNDWEFIICDDGSADETYNAVKTYAENDNRIVLIKNDKNRGLSYSLNQCLSVAAGEYCARMDGDDLCDPKRFEIQNRFLDTHPDYAFVSTTMNRFNESGYYHLGITVVSEPKEKDFIKGSPFCHAPVMIRRSAYLEVNGYRDIPQTRGVEDYDLWFRLYAKGFRGYNLEIPLYSMFDGISASHRRTWKRRKCEAWVRKEGYRSLGIPWYMQIYVLKPLLNGLLPANIYNLLRKTLRQG